MTFRTEKMFTLTKSSSTNPSSSLSFPSNVSSSIFPSQSLSIPSLGSGAVFWHCETGKGQCFSWILALKLKLIIRNFDQLYFILPVANPHRLFHHHHCPCHPESPHPPFRHNHYLFHLLESSLISYTAFFTMWNLKTKHTIRYGILADPSRFIVETKGLLMLPSVFVN